MEISSLSNNRDVHANMHTPQLPPATGKKQSCVQGPKDPAVWRPDSISASYQVTKNINKELD